MEASNEHTEQSQKATRDAIRKTCIKFMNACVKEEETRLAHRLPVFLAKAERLKADCCVEADKNPHLATMFAGHPRMHLSVRSRNPAEAAARCSKRLPAEP
jgi:hypothetical protein